MRAALLGLLLLAGDVEAPLVVVGTGTSAPRILRALDARGTRAPLLERAALATRPDAALLAADSDGCAALAQVRNAARACVLVSPERVPAGVSAVTAEVALDAQMALLARAFPGRARVLVLRSPGRSALDGALSEAAARAGLLLTLVDVRAPGEAVPALASALRGPGSLPILLALPDSAVVTADTIAPLSQAAMSARVPLVGFSPYFLKVGAVAAFSPDVDAATARALELVRTPAPAVVEPAPRGTLIVDGRLASRLGIPVAGGTDIEVRK